MHLRSRARSRAVWSALATFVAVGLCAVPTTESDAQVVASMGFHFIGSGGHPMRNACYRLSGTAGQAAPGYSSSVDQSVNAGFQAGAPTDGLDEIYFNSFEDC